MFQLTESDQQFLLQTARNAVQFYLSGQTPKLPERTAGALAEPRGVFVSIHKGHELRGCIGNIHPTSGLVRTVAECAIAAAVGDPRFMPLMMSELRDIHFEISVLSPMRRVKDISEIDVGRHGLLISKKQGRGLLLPQVASEHGWSRERFLEETCRKAGLRPDDWREGATIECFSALVFDEKQLQQSIHT
jgi:AmmeMemoRadiSam system protein A